MDWDDLLQGHLEESPAFDGAESLHLLAYSLPTPRGILEGRKTAEPGT
jgi:hypothetical protein